MPIIEALFILGHVDYFNGRSNVQEYKFRYRNMYLLGFHDTFTILQARFEISVQIGRNATRS